jgi:hypothetical protein
MIALPETSSTHRSRSDRNWIANDEILGPLVQRRLSQQKSLLWRMCENSLKLHCESYSIIREYVMCDSPSSSIEGATLGRQMRRAKGFTPVLWLPGKSKGRSESFHSNDFL